MTLRNAAGWWLLLLHYRLPAVFGDAAVRTPNIELSVDACFDHLLLPGDGDVAWGKLIEKAFIRIIQGHSLHRGESSNVVQTFSVHHFRVRDERWMQNSWREIKNLTLGGFKLKILSFESGVEFIHANVCIKLYKLYTTLKNMPLEGIGKRWYLRRGGK